MSFIVSIFGLYQKFEKQRLKEKIEREKEVKEKIEKEEKIKRIQNEIQRSIEEKKYIDFSKKTKLYLYNFFLFFEKEFILKKEIKEFKIYGEQLKTFLEKISLFDKFIIEEKLKKDLEIALRLLNNLEIKTKEINELFIQKRMSSNKVLFSSIEKYSLDEQQQRAIINPEDNVLVIAGAGSGKTSTIVGKVKYLIDVEKYKPEEILLISFTKASAKEMEERIENKIGLKLDVKTFHKFGNDILKSDGLDKVSIVDENRISKFKEFLVTDFISNLFENNQELSIELFNYLIKDEPIQIEEESSLKERKNITMLGEEVKSHEEAMIADFLFQNGIDYSYEFTYEFKTVNGEFHQYRPDFYLNDYKIYLEHFGIDKNGNVADFFGDGTKEGYEKSNKKYLDGMTWKRKIHNLNGSTLIETFSHEYSDGILFSNLKKKLEEHGIELKPLTKDEINEKIENKKFIKKSRFTNLIMTFLGLFKSRNLSLYELQDKVKSGFGNNFYEQKKSVVFIELFELIYSEYEKMLSKEVFIDFNDMINKSTELIQSGKVKVPYKYIIVDEFQDIGYGRYLLIKSLLERNNAKLFCVGDDWQSIYRFTGGDLNIFSHFEEYFDFGTKCFINKTYRYPQIVNDVTREFITKNPAQIDKALESGNLDLNSDCFEIIYYINETEIQGILKELKSKHNNLLAIGRTNNDGECCKGIVDFKTAHSSKGLEEDYVVIVNGNSGIKGFPSQIRDDYLLNLVLSESDDFLYSEERRLFYVALTRARKKTFILTKIGCKSSFVKELEVILGVHEPVFEEKKYCPQCKIGILTSGENYGKLKDDIICNRQGNCNFLISSTIKFGKHRGKKISELPKDYVDWIMNQERKGNLKQVIDSIEFIEKNSRS